jgi:cytochrome c biogenesis protein
VLEFLGSMNLAITLLVAVAVASVIGTVLQQGQSYADYLIKFGPFWFEVFKALGLYDVYSATWFLAILAFLVLSTSVCVYRHAPVIWKDMTRFRERTQATSLRVLRNHRSWSLTLGGEDARAVAEHALRSRGYRVRTRRRGEGWAVSAMKGRANRLGYLFTHIAIVVIGVGGLMDGNLPLKIREWRGELEVETRNLPISEVPEESRLAVGSGSFRGSVTIPEGQRAGVVFLPLRDGYVMQELPFDILVEDFRIEHYPSGQPRSFESDLVILDPDREEPLRQTISVNHPLAYKGYSIYQASFGDGGSRLTVRVWPLIGEVDPRTLTGRVFGEEAITIAGETRTVEFTDFQFFNVRPDPRAVETGPQFQNIGPSFTYRLRRPSGEAREFHNYMAPVAIDGALYYLSGVRAALADEFRYLHIPAGPEASPQRFMSLLGALRDAGAVERAAGRAADTILAELGFDGRRLVPEVARTADLMVARLLDGGFEAVEALLQDRVTAEGVPAERRETLLQFSRLVLEQTLAELYRGVLAEERGGPVAEVALDADAQRFFRDALTAISGLSRYGGVAWLQLTGFEHVQATGLQITRAPGTIVVYTGFALLTVGVFLLFYVGHRRAWALVIARGGTTELLIAGVSQRQADGFKKEFAELGERVDAAVAPFKIDNQVAE